MRSFNSFAPFLTAIQQQLISVGGFATECVQLSMFDEFPRFIQGTPICVVIPLDFKSWPSAQDGGGTEMTVWDGQIKVKIVVLNTLDPPFGDPDVLTDSNVTLGLYTLVDTVTGALQMFDGCDTNGNSFLVEPCRLVSGSRPLRDEDHSQYCWVDLVFNYRQNEAFVGVS